MRAAWDAGAEHLVVTGDLTEDGVDAQFGVVAEVLAASPWPAHRVTLVPGNHDAYADAGAFDRALDGPLARFAGTSRPGAMTVLDGAVVVAASTAIAQTYPRAIGALDEAALASIERAAGSPRRAAASRSRRCTTRRSRTRRRSSAWIDGLVDDAPIQRLLARHDRLAVLHGHTHRATSSPCAPAPRRACSARARVVDAGPGRAPPSLGAVRRPRRPRHDPRRAVLRRCLT